MLERATITETSLSISEQLDRDLYERVNKVLVAAGGKWNRKAKAHVFAKDPRDVLGFSIQTGEIVDTKKTFEAFFTPPEIARLLVDTVIDKLEDGTRVLEPSAGTGALLKALPLTGAFRVTAFELNNEYAGECGEYALSRDNRDRWQSFGLVTGDFLQATVDEIGLFDVILMNPPFSEQVRHITKALEFLAPGGRLSAITAPSWKFRERKEDVAFRNHPRMAGHKWIELPPAAFKSSGTAVNTGILVIGDDGGKSCGHATSTVGCVTCGPLFTDESRQSK